MNYQKIYDQFIADRRLKESLLAAPYDRHHILPKCFGGTNTAENLIALSFADHLFAHLLLAQIYRGKMRYAAQVMLNRVPGTCGKIARRQYGWVRAQHARETALWQTQRMQNPELRKRTADALKGKPKSAEAIAKRSISRRGKKASMETRAKLSAAHIGRKLSPEHAANIAASRKGHIKTDAHRLALSLAAERDWKKRLAQGYVIPRCAQTGRLASKPTV
jgi:hypothetical protein